MRINLKNSRVEEWNSRKNDVLFSEETSSQN
jgi:hypothetical protein